MAAKTFELRKKDWRVGAIVYQIFVDRFFAVNPAYNKLPSYAVVKKWNELPERGVFLEKYGVYSHELEFYLGNLAGVCSKLDYLSTFKVDVVYLNPIFEALTNHMYDTWDYFKINPVYGDINSLKKLSDFIHKRGMYLILDGVFNHMGAGSPMFKEAANNKKSKFRDFFIFSKNNTYAAWMNVKNLPCLNYKNPEVRDFIYKSKNSVVKFYLSQGLADGFRLDVAYDLGCEILKELKKEAEKVRKDAWIIGEVYNYPDGWFSGLSGILNMHLRKIIFSLIRRKLNPLIANMMIEKMIKDSGIENILKSWIVLDNHDIFRLNTEFKKEWQVKMARFLQFTLPGAVCMYYGSEVGMTGRKDPEQRAPMEWEKANNKNKWYRFHKELAQFREREPALRYGDYVPLYSDEVFAFLRRTDKVNETVVIVVNPYKKDKTVVLQVPDWRIQNGTKFNVIFSERIRTKTYFIDAGVLELKVCGSGYMALKPEIVRKEREYSPYNRID